MPMVSDKSEAAAVGGPAQMAANEIPCGISKFFVALRCATGLPWGLPSELGRSDLKDKTTSSDVCTASPPDQ